MRPGFRLFSFAYYGFRPAKAVDEGVGSDAGWRHAIMFRVLRCGRGEVIAQAPGALSLAHMIPSGRRCAGNSRFWCIPTKSAAPKLGILTRSLYFKTHTSACIYQRLPLIASTP